MKKLIVYNRSDKPIFIVAEYLPDPNGGPGIPVTQFLIAPRDGMDLSIIGLELEEEEKKDPPPSVILRE